LWPARLFDWAIVRKEKALHTPAHVAQLGLPR
jgi:hypothetical protein